MPDELFSPTIRDRRTPGAPPWRPESIVYPAFFGGPLAATLLGILNGRRLALPSSALLTIGGVGAAAVAGRIAVSTAIDGMSGIRLAGNAAGLLVWLVILAFQRRRFRAFSLGSTEPASLVGPGFAAAIGCGLLEALVVLVVLA